MGANQPSKICTYNFVMFFVFYSASINFDNCNNKIRKNHIPKYTCQQKMSRFWTIVDWKYPFWANLLQKMRLSRNLVLRLIIIHKTQCFSQKMPFLDKFGPKIQHFAKWNLSPGLIRICRTQCDVHVIFLDDKYSFSANFV